MNLRPFDSAIRMNLVVLMLWMACAGCTAFQHGYTTRKYTNVMLPTSTAPGIERLRLERGFDSTIATLVDTVGSPDYLLVESNKDVKLFYIALDRTYSIHRGLGSKGKGSFFRGIASEYVEQFNPDDQNRLRVSRTVQSVTASAGNQQPPILEPKAPSAYQHPTVTPELHVGPGAETQAPAQPTPPPSSPKTILRDQSKDREVEVTEKKVGSSTASFGGDQSKQQEVKVTDKKIGSSVVSFGGETENVTVLGITLGKSLRTAGMRECRISTSSSYKSYDFNDSNCYKIEDFSSSRSCFTEVIPNLSFHMTVYVDPLDRCDRQSPIQEIQGTFHSDNYGKVLILMIDKFGQPQKTEKSVTQNRMGAKFERIESSWNIRGHSIYLTNISSKVDQGGLIITHPDKIRKDGENIRKNIKSDRDKF